MKDLIHPQMILLTVLEWEEHILEYKDEHNQHMNRIRHGRPFLNVEIKAANKEKKTVLNVKKKENSL